MKNLESKLAAMVLQLVTEQMNDKGYTLRHGLLSNEQFDKLLQNYRSLTF